MKHPVLTVRDLGVYLKVSRSTIYRWIKNGGGPKYFRVGSDFRFNIESVEEWIRETSTDTDLLKPGLRDAPK
jgi:excisionase family DNA binding protein